MAKKIPIEQVETSTDGPLGRTKRVKISKGHLNRVTTTFEKKNPTAPRDAASTARHRVDDTDVAVKSLKTLREIAYGYLKGFDPQQQNLAAYAQNCRTNDPFSKVAYAAKLVKSIDQILNYKNSNLTLDALQLSGAIHNFVLATDLNESAVKGERQEQSLKSGPETKAQRSKQKNQIALQIAEEYWRQNPRQRSNISATARAISASVEAEYRKHGLIAEHARLKQETLRRYIG